MHSINKKKVAKQCLLSDFEYILLNRKTRLFWMTAVPSYWCTVWKRFKRNNKGVLAVLDVYNRLRMSKKWIVFLFVRKWIRQRRQGFILCNLYVLLLSLAAKRLGQVNFFSLAKIQTDNLMQWWDVHFR